VPSLPGSHGEGIVQIPVGPVHAALSSPATSASVLSEKPSSFLSRGCSTRTKARKNSSKNWIHRRCQARRAFSERPLFHGAAYLMAIERMMGCGDQEKKPGRQERWS